MTAKLNKKCIRSNRKSVKNSSRWYARLYERFRPAGLDRRQSRTKLAQVHQYEYEQSGIWNVPIWCLRKHSASSSLRFYVLEICAELFHGLQAHDVWQLFAVQNARAHVRAQHGRRALHGLQLELQRACLRARKGRTMRVRSVRCHAVVLMCCCPHAVVHMFAGRCAGQLPASQTFSMCIQPDSQLHLGSPPRKFSSVQFSYRLSVISYRLLVIGYQYQSACCCPHAIRFGPRVFKHVRSPPSSM